MIASMRRRVARYLHRPALDWSGTTVPNPTSPEFEVDKWATSDFVVRRLVPLVGIHPYPLDELLLMVAAIVRLRPAHVYEWGTHHGASARIFREAAMAFGVACRIDSIDLPDDVEHAEHPHESRGHLVRGLPDVRLHQGDGLDVSLRLLREVPDTGPVLFFLDGDHAYASVRRELTAIAAAAPEASFLLHDTFFQSPEAGYNVGPHEALAEFIQSHAGKTAFAVCLARAARGARGVHPVARGGIRAGRDQPGVARYDTAVSTAGMTVRRFTPMPALEMRLGRAGQPAAFHWRRRWHTVATVEKTGTIQTEWWRGDDERIDRPYHQVTTREGMICVIFRDGVADLWHLESIYD